MAKHLAAMEDTRILHNFWQKNLKGRDQKEDLDVNRRTKFKPYTLQK
jgi:hypothetical protein